jgi:tetratricopeptide (TPR) repeat protein
MSLRRASGRSLKAALAGVVCCAALSACSDVTRSRAIEQPVNGRIAESVLSPAEQRRAEALAEYGTGVSDEIRGNLDDALDRYLRVLQLDPQNTRLAVRLGQIYISKRDFTNAVDVLQTSLQTVPNNPEVLYWLAFSYQADNRDDKAATAFHQALKADPNNLNALGGLLDIDMQKDALPDVNKLLEHAFRHKSESSAYWMRLGDMYVLISKQKPTWAAKINHKRIQDCYEKALALAPDDADVVMRVADAYADNGDFAEAAKAYAKLLAEQPDTPQIRERLALNYIRADQKEKAAAVLEDIIKREPLHYGIYNYLAEVYEDLNQDEKAVSNYQQSIVINPNQLMPYLRLSLLQIKLKQIDAAAKTLNAAKGKFPTAYFVPYYFGLLYSEQKEYGKAITSFADAEALAASSPEEMNLDGRFYFYYAAACERNGDFDRAVTLFRKCIQLDPENDGACNYLGFMWADKGVHLEEALDLIQKAVKLDPNNGAYIDSLGWVLFKLGCADEARVQLQRAVTLTKDDATVYGHLADVLLKLGKTEEALLALRRAKELDPDNKDISEKLQKLSGNQSAAH